jgi:hypothetical protein
MPCQCCSPLVDLAKKLARCSLDLALFVSDLPRQVVWSNSEKIVEWPATFSHPVDLLLPVPESSKSSLEFDWYLCLPIPGTVHPRFYFFLCTMEFRRLLRSFLAIDAKHSRIRGSQPKWKRLPQQKRLCRQKGEIQIKNKKHQD